MSKRIFAVVPGLKEEDSGEVDISEMENSEDQTVRSAAEKLLISQRDTERQMCPAGELGLPPELDAARRKHGIIDSVFDWAAEFERVFIWQLPEQETRYKDSSILIPEASQKRINEETPKGIIVSAGLSALDYLHGHGMKLGEEVMFVRAAPWRITVGYICHKPVYVLVLTASDIVGSRDKVKRIRSGALEYVLDEEQNRHYCLSEGKKMNPESPKLEMDHV